MICDRFADGEQAPRGGVGGGRHTDSMATDVTVREIVRLRQHTQRIDPRGADTAADTVRHLLAMQAQDFGNALWAVGVRTRHSTRSAVLAALQRGEVVRTLPMRGTLHFIAPEDLRWLLALTSSRTLQAARARFEALGLDSVALAKAESIALANVAGAAFSREDFLTLLTRNGIAPDGQRGYHVIFYLAQRGVVCWGPPAGTQQALVLVDEWVPPQVLPDRDASLAALARRYFAGHGPATERDLAWWAKLPLADVRAGIAFASDSLTELTCAGTRYWIATSELPAAPGRTARTGVRALPGFDEYLLGYQDRALVLPAPYAERIVPGNNGIFLPMITSAGGVVGTWRRTPRSKAAQIDDDYFGVPTPSQLAGFARAAGDYARFTLN